MGYLLKSTTVSVKFFFPGRGPYTKTILQWKARNNIPKK